MIRLRAGPYSFADFLELIPEDQKADLIEGNILMASPENIEHNDLLAWLTQVLGMFITERHLGKLSVKKVAYRLTDDTAPEPDLGFVRTDRLSLRKRGYVEGPPDVAIEIVSPDSVDRDYELKRQHYEAGGVQEYWIIDPEERRATFLVRANDQFAETAAAGDIYVSRAIPGFRLDVRWLRQRPLPSPLATVQTLLQNT